MVKMTNSDLRTENTMVKMKNSDLQNTTQKTKDRIAQIPLKARVVVKT